MLTRTALKRINERPRKVNRLPLALIGAGSVVVSALLVTLTSSLLFGLVALAAGAAGVLVSYRLQKTRAVTAVTYGDLQGELEARFVAVQEGCEALSSSDMIWHLSDPPEQRTRQSGDAFLPQRREPAHVGLLETPGIRADVPIWGIDSGNAKVFFFPDAVLVYRHERYEGVSYESLEVSISSARFYERDTVPEDAQVVAERTTRSRMPVVLYALVEISVTSGLEVTLQVSSRDAAHRFARAFGVEEAREEAGKADERQKQGQEEDTRRTREYFDSLTMKEKARIVSAYMTLGVSKGASMEEISAAYKKLARAHHPDKVAMLEPEERVSSERRMKEINAAYTELKRLRRDLMGGAG
jgi:DnaJ-domain-containing protein 1